MQSVRHGKSPGTAQAREKCGHPPSGAHQPGARPLQDRSRQARAQSQTVMLMPFIDEVIGTARQLAEQNHNRFVLDAPDESRRHHHRRDAATANPAQSAEQCLQFTKQGEVALRARRSVDGRGWFEFDVADTGIGMTRSSCRRYLRNSPRPMLQPRNVSAEPASAFRSRASLRA